MSQDPPSPRARQLAATDEIDSADTATVELPAYYAREIAEREQLARECPVDVYISGVNPRYGWPYRLVSGRRPTDAAAAAAAAGTVIVDSVIQDEYFPVREVFAVAADVDADIAVLKDWPGEDIHALDAYDHLVPRYRESDFEGDLLLPVSPPLTQTSTIRHLLEDDRSPVTALGVGGQSRERGARQVAALREAREAFPEAYIHAFGVGTDLDVIAALRESIRTDDRPLVDSLDTSTPEHAPAKNRVADKTWSQTRVPLPEGDDVTTVRAGFTVGMAAMLAHELSPSKADDDALDAGTSDLSRFS